MLVSDIRVVTSDINCELRGTVTSNASGEPVTLWYRFPISLRAYVRATNGDVWLAALLPVAMRLRERLTIDAYVSGRVMRRLESIQTYYTSLDPSLAEVAVEAPMAGQDVGRHNPSDRVGLFFSLGVDSFYSLFKRIGALPEAQEKPPQLILIHGFDIFVDGPNSELFPKVLANARMVARTLGTEVLCVSNNLRHLSDYFVDWGVCHGAAMASVGLALQGYFAEIVVAGGKTGRYAHSEPWGSSPDLDPLWSTERLTFVHDGCEASRLDKIRLITRFPIVLETLRVCWENPSNEYNCCKCEKCLRTMLGLHIAGVLPECKTFALPIDPGLLRELPRLPGNVKAEYQRMIDALGPSAFEVAVKSSLVESLAKQ